MKRWHRIALAGASALAVGALFYAADGYGSRYCFALKAANFAREAKDRIAPIDCLEFWINRYQSAWAAMLGTAAALTAAWIAWSIAQRQIRQQARSVVFSEMSFWQDRVEKTEAEIEELEFALGIFTDVVNVELEARMAGGENKFEAKLFARYMHRNGIIPFSTIHAAGAVATCREFNRRAQRLERIATTQTQANPVLSELQEAFSDLMAYQSDMILALTKLSSELHRAQKMVDELTIEQMRLAYRR